MSYFSLIRAHVCLNFSFCRMGIKHSRNSGSLGGTFEGTGVTIRFHLTYILQTPDNPDYFRLDLIDSPGSLPDTTL
jgi:hypothetical protein